MLLPAMIEEYQQRIRDAAARNRPVCIRGGGTKDFYGQSLIGDILDTRSLSGIVSYYPTELVITARAGTPLAEIEAVLAQKGQILPFEPPHFGDGATLGGCVAAGLSGPRRARAGGVRDYLLGVKLIDGRGELQSFGGQVMKNVAGYDVSRLMAGSLGTLALLVEMSLKVLPIPPAERTLRFEMPEERALEALNRWAAQPLPISASAYTEGDLGLRLSGATAAVEAACRKLGGELVEPAPALRFWRGIREQTDSFFQDGGLLWRLSVPSVAAPLALPGKQLIEWDGGLRWLGTNADADRVRAAAVEAGGHATLFRGGDAQARRVVGVFQPLPETMMNLHRRLKHAFDPQGILNPGRMFLEW